MKDVVSRFLAFVHSMPEHPAVVQESSTVSYGELGSLARRMALAISKIHSKPRVLIHLPKGAEAYAAMYGTLMAGGYYCPINMDAPVHRHGEIIKQFRPHVVVSKQGIEERPLDDAQATVIVIDNLPEKELKEALPANDLAYVIFTSGSTGQPKGVMIPRTALSHYASWAIEAMEITPQDRWSQHPNIAFDLSVLDIYGALCGGATLYPLESRKDKMLPADFIRRHQLTIWDSVPSVIDLMIRARQANERNFNSLRLLTFCGEPLYKRHLDAIFEAHEDVLVHNTYGPTEATVSCTLVRLTSSNYEQYCDHSVALGQPIQGMQIVLEGGEHENEGEVILLGEQLAAGYWDNDSETQRAFISIQGNGQDQMAYRTGDWAVRRKGDYYFAGRMDSQVKIRGNRVELDEIDATIFALGFGNSCTVYSGGQLHSFLEAAQLPDIAEFRKAVATRLPEYEVPEKILAVPHFPRNANDKIDRRQLVEAIDNKNVNENGNLQDD